MRAWLGQQRTECGNGPSVALQAGPRWGRGRLRELAQAAVRVGLGADASARTAPARWRTLRRISRVFTDLFLYKKTANKWV